MFKFPDTMTYDEWVFYINIKKKKTLVGCIKIILIVFNGNKCQNVSPWDLVMKSSINIFIVIYFCIPLFKSLQWLYFSLLSFFFLCLFKFEEDTILKSCTEATSFTERTQQQHVWMCMKLRNSSETVFIYLRWYH